jgi:hypothetical protein
MQDDITNSPYGSPDQTNIAHFTADRAGLFLVIMEPTVVTYLS